MISQMIFVSGSAMTVTIGGIIGSKLAPTSALSTLPISLTVAGTALGTLPATGLMQRFGRKMGFSSAALLATVACLVSLIAISQQTFWLYCISTFLIGVSLAFSQQFRFAATETVTIDKAGSAISAILLGSVGGAIIGPELVSQSRHLWPAASFLGPEKNFSGAIAGAGLLYLFAAILLQGLTLTKERFTTQSIQAEPRSLRLIAAEPLFLLAIAAGVVGQGIMTFVMTATPVSMHILDGHSVADTASVIRAHVLAMYLPSLASGLLISQFGERRLMAVGLLIYIATMAIAWSGQEVFHYGSALILLGVGWNFLFVGGTTLLVKTYRPVERFRAQGFNEALVFGTSAVASLLAGVVLSGIGWQAVVLATLVPIVLLGAAVVRYLSRPLPQQSADTV